MLMLSRSRHNLRDFCFRDLIIEYAANALAFRVHLQHYLGRARPLHGEYGFQNIDNELHRREIVINQHDAIQRWRLIADLEQALAAV